MIICCKYILCFFYFCGLHKPRKYFYNENFQIYGIYGSPGPYIILLCILSALPSQCTVALSFHYGWGSYAYDVLMCP